MPYTIRNTMTLHGSGARSGSLETFSHRPGELHFVGRATVVEGQSGGVTVGVGIAPLVDVEFSILSSDPTRLVATSSIVRLPAGGTSVAVGLLSFADAVTRDGAVLLTIQSTTPGYTAVSNQLWVRVQDPNVTGCNFRDLRVDPAGHVISSIGGTGDIEYYWNGNTNHWNINSGSGDLLIRRQRWTAQGTNTQTFPRSCLGRRTTTAFVFAIDASGCSTEGAYSCGCT